LGLTRTIWTSWMSGGEDRSRRSTPSRWESVCG
jgi:hypothetical protein